MDHYRMKFLVKAVLGQKTEVEKPKMVIRKCIEKAYDDMNVVGRFYSEGREKKEFCDKYEDLLEKYGYTFSRELIGKASTLFANEKTIENEIGKVTTYGLAQKLVNMTFKYLYIFYAFIDMEIDFRTCDCPLDSTILNHLNETKLVWSRLDDIDYKKLQDKVKLKMEEERKDGEYFPDDNGSMAYDIHW